MKHCVNLTDKKLEILQFVAKGLTNEEIGKSMGISVHTVKAHMEQIFYYFKVTSRVQVVTSALKQNVLKFEDL